MRNTLVVIGLLLVCLLSCIPAFAQDTYTAPQFAITGGLGFNHSDSPQFKGWGMFEKSTSANTSIIGIADLGTSQATISPGVKEYFWHASPIHLFSLVTVGATVSTTAGSSTAGIVISAGGGIDYEFPGLLKNAGVTTPGSPPRIVPYATTIVGIQEIPNKGPSFLYLGGIGFKFN